MKKQHLWKIALLVWLCCSFWNVSSQATSIQKFTPESAKFIKEVQTLLSPVKIDAISFNGKSFMEQFQKDWDSGVYSPQEQEKMFSIVNKMVDKQFQVRTYVSYFICSQRLKHRRQDVKGWETWHESLDDIATYKKHVVLSDYLTFTENLLLRNTFSSYRKIEWITSDSNFLFRFDSLPFIEMPHSDIFLVFNKDTVKIHQTSAKYYPLLHIVKGTGGKLYWDRNKIPHDKVWAELSSYSLETLIQEISLKDVRFYNTDYFQSPITGTIEDKAYNNDPKAPYPKFISDRIDLSIHQLYNNFEYKGGFRMSGADVYGFGTDKQPADLYVHVNKVNNISMQSIEFAFSPEYMSSDKISFKIQCEKDSLYHPEMMMVYNNKTQEIALMKSKGSMGAMSVIDSYHKVDINCEALSWKLDAGEIDFSSDIGVKKTSSATFTSQNYFRAGNYRKVQGLDNENPLDILTRLSNRLGRNFLSYEEVAYEMKITITQAKLLMSELAQKDFLFLDYVNEGILLRDKAKIYPAAYMRTIDYDNLVFQSQESKINAKLILDTMDMYIFNIQRIWLSDSQAVGIMTYVDDIVLQKNRNFSFRGFVGAGSFDFFTDSLVYSHFNYEDFSITLPLISSLEFWVDDTSNVSSDGHFQQLPITSFIEQISGKLYIDHPDNKSGIKHYDKYSYFEANITDESAIYYDKAYAVGKYPKDQFRFKVFPFFINDLQKASIENMNIPGVLQSSNIIPDLETVSTLRSDYSLGFSMLSPASGFPMYGGKGIFKGTIDLSNHGFFADGTLNYLTSTSITDDAEMWEKNSFVFFPDSSIATLNSFDIQEVRTGVEFPKLHGSQIFQTWHPSQDLMIVKNLENPFSVFKEQLLFSGEFHLSPMGLKGLGDINLTQMSIVSSKEFSFKSTSFSSSSADVSILSMDLSKPVFNAYNYSFTMDLEKRNGQFLTFNDSSYVNFPENHFMATGFHFLLNMDSMTFNLYASEKDNQYAQLKNLNFTELIDLYDNGQIHGPLVTSTNIDHNGFHFNSFRAKLSVLQDRHKINFYEIPLIKIADSYIIPKDRQFEVEDHPDTIYLNESELMLKKDSIHHYIYDADLRVLGQDEYRSKNALYDYISRTDTIPIFLNDIYIDKKTKTSIAKGKISDSINFKPSPYFNYYGDVLINCESPFLNFNGYLRMNDDDCDSLEAPWISIDTLIDPKNPVIPIPVKTFDDENHVTFTGLAHGYDGQHYHFYNSLFGRIKNARNDDTIFSINGLMVFDELFNEYRIGNRSVLDNPTEPYNLLRYNPSTCMTIGNGVINLNPKFTQKNVNIQAYGSYYYDHSIDSLYFDVTTAIQLPLGRKLMEKIVGLLYNSYAPAGEDFHKPFMNKYLNYRIGKERNEDLKTNYLSSKYTLPKVFLNTFIFSHIPLRWRQSVYTYYYSGEAELSIAHNKVINKKIPLTIGYVKHRNGNRDMLQIYFEADDDNRFYIYLSEKGKSYIWSSNAEIKELITGKNQEKKDENEPTDSKNELDFEWMEESSALDFINHIESFETK